MVRPYKSLQTWKLSGIGQFNPILATKMSTFNAIYDPDLKSNVASGNGLTFLVMETNLLYFNHQAIRIKYLQAQYDLDL